jgi:serine/threonine protein kinase
MTRTHVRTVGISDPADPSTYGVAPVIVEAGLPERVGRFLPRARLGSGAFGVVYRAYDPHLERDVALKLTRIESMHGAEELKRYLHEARAAARLRHPRIVPIFEAGRESEYAYIASSYIPGETLAEAMGRGQFDPSESRRIARIVRDLADALAYAHDLGIVHRDVKPSNVLLDEQGKPHLLDFGLAVRREDPAREGEIAGTPQYLSPEVARGEPATPATDQYGLGLILYYLLIGEPPFSGSLKELLEQIEETEPAPPHVIDSRVPRALSEVCRRAMTKHPKARFADCREMAQAIRDWMRHDSDGAISTIVARLPMVEAIRSDPRALRRVFGALTALVAMAIVGLLLFAVYEVVQTIRGQKSPPAAAGAGAAPGQTVQNP